MTDVIRYGFVAGEVSESYYGRADLEKYDLALAEAENWFVDYHGGISNVQGTAFVDWIDNADAGFRLFPFRFSDTIANKYLILVGNGYIRFIQNGSYILETAKAVSAVSKGTTTTLTCTGHGYSTGNLVQIVTPGQMIELSAQTFKIVVVDANNFRIKDLFDNEVNSTSFTSYTSGMTVGRVYTVTHSYAAGDLENLKTQQVRDVVRMTHPDYKTMNLRRYGNANWTLTQESLAKPINRPGKPSLSAVNSGKYGTGYIVSAVDADGNEGLPSDMGIISGCSDIEEVKDSAVIVSWTAASNTDYYNIYRTRVAYQGGITRSFQVGYIGRSRGNRFIDSGITPDFTKTPQRNLNPFARRSIKYINILNDGSGISSTANMTVTDATGSGFIGYPIVVGGNVVGFNILDGGENYTAPTITLSSGSGYVFNIELSDATNTDPGTSTVYQQRQIYAGPRGKPLTIFGSRPGKLSDFAVSEILVPDDSFAHELDSENYSPIRHLIPTRGGIIVMSSGGIWLMAGSNSGAITATDVQAEANVYTGVADVTPLKIDTDILYISNTGGRVNALAYNDQFKIYSPVDVSILSNHLLKRYTIKRWAYADEPHRLTHAVRGDGTMLLFTMIKDQEVYGWSRRVTKGYYKDVLSLDGDGATEVYYVVKRQINGKWVTLIEQLVTDQPITPDDAVYLDCSLSLGKNFPEATLQLGATTGTGVTATLDVNYFNSGHVGQIIRYGKGKARIAAVTNGTNATVNIFSEFDQTMNYANVPRAAIPGEWTLDPEYTVVNGLLHLEGETVTALADGNVIQHLVVTNGKVTLPQAASRVVIGIPYKSYARSLPLTVNGAVIENKRKRVTSMAIRVLDTRGLKVGANKNELYQLKTRMAKTLGQASPLYSGITHTSIEPVWSEDAQHYFVQEYPLPATILGYILETEVGDG